MRQALLLAATCFVARGFCIAAEQYFPLEIGNRWVYACTGECSDGRASIEVTRSERSPRGAYFLARAWGREIWLRAGPDGRILARNSDTGNDEQWYWFDAPEGQNYQTAIHPCNPNAAIASRNEHYSGPGGAFDQVLRITYVGTCNFAGLVEERFGNGVGLLQRIENTGATKYDLIFARVGGKTVAGGRELAFGLSLDRAVYTLGAGSAPPRLSATVSLVNHTEDPIELVFPSGERYRVAIRNEQGATVLEWSNCNACIALFGTEHFTGKRDYIAAFALADPNGNSLPPGKYTAQAWLATMPPAYTASVAFAIR